MKKKNKEDNALFIQRFFAFIFDILLVSILVSVVCTPFLDYDAIQILNENANKILVDYANDVINTETYISSVTSIFYRLAKKQGLISLMLIFFNILYFVVYQFYNKGQTFGKKLMKIKVISNDSKELTMDNYILRSSIVNSIILDMVIFAFVIFANEDVWFFGTGIVGAIDYILLFVCGLMVILNKNGRGLHDLVGNTKVIRCRK